MAVVVLPHHPEGFPVPLQQGHGGVVPGGGLLPGVPQGDTLEVRQQEADGVAVGEEGQGFPGVRPGDVLHGGLDPGQHLRRGLRPGDGPAVHAAAEVRHGLRRGAGDVPPGPALPVPHADFPETRAAVEGQAVGAADGRGGGPGAVEVAGVNRVDADVRKAALQGPDLPPAPVGEAALVLALGDAVEVALRLGVADEVDGGHGGSSRKRLIFHSIPRLAGFGKWSGGFFRSRRANCGGTEKE